MRTSQASTAVVCVAVLCMTCLGIQFTPLLAQEQEKKLPELAARLAGTKWINTNKVTFEWDVNGRFFHGGKERQYHVVDEKRLTIEFSENHVDTLVFDSQLTTFEQFSTREPNKKPLFTGMLIAREAERKPTKPDEAQASEGKKWDHLDLTDAKVMGDFVRINPDKAIATKKAYSGPVEITVLARTDKNNIRLWAFKGGIIIFNWEVTAGDMRIHRPDDLEKGQVGSVAVSKQVPLKPDTWYTLRWTITEEGMEVAVDNKVVFSEEREYDLSKVRPIRVSGAFGSVVDVKSLVVVTLAAKKPAVAAAKLSEPPTVLEEHKGAVTALLFSPNGKVMMTGGDDGNVVLWELPSLKKLDSLKNCPTHSLAISPNGKTLVAGSGAEPKAEIWDVEKRKKVTSLQWKAGDGGAANVAFSPDGKELVVGVSQLPGVDFMWQGSLYLVDTENWKVKHSFGRTLALPGLAVSPDGKTLVVDGSDAIIEFDLATRKPRNVDPYIGFTYGFSSLAFSPDGKYKASGRSFLGQAPEGGQVRQGRLFMEAVPPKGKPLWKDIKKNNNGISVAFSPDSKLFATGIAGSERAAGELILWHTETKEELTGLKHTTPVNCIAFSPNGSLLAAGVGAKVLVYKIVRGE